MPAFGPPDIPARMSYAVMDGLIELKLNYLLFRTLALSRAAGTPQLFHSKLHWIRQDRQEAYEICAAPAAAQEGIHGAAGRFGLHWPRWRRSDRGRP